MNEFSRLHPAVTFVYFIAVMIFAMVLKHPVCVCISLVSSIAYMIFFGGRRAAYAAAWLVPMILAAALINAAFNHQGVTVLTYLPSGNPLTREAIIYGGVYAACFAAAICWFSCFNAVMTSDKLLCLFAKILPSVSLAISMTLRFVPRFRVQIKRLTSVRRAAGMRPAGMRARISEAVAVTSAMATWSLENSIEIADSMKNRGYGLAGRTAFTIFAFTKRDAAVIISAAALAAITGIFSHALKFTYLPYIAAGEINSRGTAALAAYAALCAIPAVLEIIGRAEWKYTKHKI